MFTNLADSGIPMVTFATGRDIEDRPGKVGEYILSKYIAQELALHKYNHIAVLKIWGCFGKYEKETRFFTDNMLRIKRGEPILVRENRLFSYVYVKDLVKIIDSIKPLRQLIKVVGYTQSLLEYAWALKKITEYPYKIIMEENNFSHSYQGENTFNFNYTPLETALKEMWDVLSKNG